MTPRQKYLLKGTSNERRGKKSEGAHGEDINNPDFIDLVEFLKTFKRNLRVNSKLESPSS